MYVCIYIYIYVYVLVLYIIYIHTTYVYFSSGSLLNFKCLLQVYMRKQNRIPFSFVVNFMLHDFAIGFGSPFWIPFDAGGNSPWFDEVEMVVKDG